jgi:hypothetical protein
MPTWTNEVPAIDPDSAYTLVRTPADKPLIAIATSTRLIGTYTHFWTGRTIPCEATRDPETGQIDPTTCPACRELQPKRWHGYTAAYDPKTKATFIFEVTARAAAAFEAYTAAHGTLRGCMFMAHRPRPGRNGRVEIATKPADLNKINLPQAPNLIRALSVIWQLPATAVHTHDGLNGTATAALEDETLKRMRGHLPAPETDRNPDHITAILFPRGNGDGQ